MMRTCVIMQPTYLPWIGYFDLIRSADVFVFLDDVQFSKQSWQQRNKIRDKNGEILLTLSTKKNKEQRAIQTIQIDHQRNILKKHLNAFRINYSKSRNFEEIFTKLEKIYTSKPDLLVKLNIDLIKMGCDFMGLSSKFLKSSNIINTEEGKVERLVSICKHVECNNYLSPQGSKAYIEANNIFSVNGMSLSFQDYEHPVYKQLEYNNFISHLSFIDFLFNTENYERF